MGRKTVEDDVDLRRRTQNNEILQKAKGVLDGVVNDGLAANCAGRGVQRRVQEEPPLCAIFKCTFFGAAGQKRQQRIETVQRLNGGGLLVDAEDGRVLRRVHASRLVSKVRLVAGQLLLQAVRPQIGFLPHQSHGVLADTQSRSYLAAVPGCGASPGSLLVAIRIRACSLGGHHRGPLSGMSDVQPIEPTARKRCFQRMIVGAVVPLRCLMER